MINFLLHFLNNINLVLVSGGVAISKARLLVYLSLKASAALVASGLDI